MTATAKYRLCENNGLLISAIDKVTSSLRKPERDIILINIHYREDNRSGVLYSGMNYIAKLRGERGDSACVLFYGFENLDSLERKPEAAILKSPSVDYIQMPFELSSLKESLMKLSSINKQAVLDHGTKKLLADNKDKELYAEVRGFVHDWRNGVTYLTALLNNLRENQTDPEAVIAGIAELKRYGADFISKKHAAYDAMRGAVEQKFKKCKKMTGLSKKMQISENKYSSMYSGLEKGQKGKASVIALLSALQETIDDLKKVEDIIDECTKR